VEILMSLGADFAGVEDIDPAMTWLEGETNELLAAAQDFARRFLQPRGALWYSPNDCLDMRMFLVDVIPKEVAQNMLIAEGMKEPRVTNVEVTITELPDSPGNWKVEMKPTFSNESTFELTFNASPTKVGLISLGPAV
jgi:hypothetical protein